MNQPQPETETTTLREKIERWSADHLSDYPPEVLKIINQKTENLLNSGILSTCLGVNDSAPDFNVPKPDGTCFHLADRLQDGPVILSFYRGTWCPYCNLEFQEHLSTLSKYRSSGTMVLALSPQVAERFQPTTEVGFEDLCDRGNKVAKQYGLVHELDSELQRIYRNFGINLNELNEDSRAELPIPATYIVDQNSKVRFAFTSVDPSVRAEPTELVAVLNSL